MPKRTDSYRESLLKDLREPSEAMAYLKAALEDSPEAFRAALRNVFEAAANDGRAQLKPLVPVILDKRPDVLLPIPTLQPEEDGA